MDDKKKCIEILENILREFNHIDEDELNRAEQNVIEIAKEGIKDLKKKK